MSEDEIGKLVTAAKMNLCVGARVLIGASAALRHGTKQPQKLKEGDALYWSIATAVEGYQSGFTFSRWRGVTGCDGYDFLVPSETRGNVAQRHRGIFR